MRFSFNSEQFAEFTKNQLSEMFQNILERYDEWYSIKITAITKIDEQRQEYEPINPQDPKYQELIKRIHK